MLGIPDYRTYLTRQHKSYPNVTVHRNLYFTGLIWEYEFTQQFFPEKQERLAYLKEKMRDKLPSFFGHPPLLQSFVSYYKEEIARETTFVNALTPVEEHQHLGQEPPQPHSITTSVTADDLKAWNAIREFLIETIKKRDIVIESCPSSNKQVGYFQNDSELPVFYFQEKQVPFIISSDDPALFNTTYANELKLFREQLMALGGIGKREIEAALASHHKRAIKHCWIYPESKDPSIFQVDAFHMNH